MLQLTITTLEHIHSFSLAYKFMICPSNKCSAV